MHQRLLALDGKAVHFSPFRHNQFVLLIRLNGMAWIQSSEIPLKSSSLVFDIHEKDALHEEDLRRECDHVGRGVLCRPLLFVRGLKTLKNMNHKIDS